MSNATLTLVTGMIVVKDLEYKKPYEGPSTCKKTSMSELKLFIASGADEIQIQKIVHKDKKRTVKKKQRERYCREIVFIVIAG